MLQHLACGADRGTAASGEHDVALELVDHTAGVRDPFTIGTGAGGRCLATRGEHGNAGRGQERATR